MTTARNEAIAVGSTDAGHSDPGQRGPAPSEPGAARLDALIESIPGIVFQRLLRPDGTLSYPFVSSSVALHTGYRPDQLRLARDGSLDVIHWADRDANLARVHESARTLKTCDEGFRVIARTGEVRWLAGASVPRRLEDGSVLWDGTLIDVTDQKRAEQWLGMVMDHAADVIITMNDAGLIDSSNAASRVVFGCDPDSLIGQPASTLMPQLEQGDLSEVLRQYLNTGETTLVGQGPRELIGRHFDGRLFPIEMVLSEVLTEGRRLFIAVIRDISQRKETETALLETQRRLTNIADNLQGLVFQRVLTDDGHLRFLYITGMTLETLDLSSQAVIDDGDLLLNAMDPEDRKRFLEAAHHSARTLDPMEDDYKIVSREGAERWLRGWSRPYRTDDGTVVWEGVTLDVTDRKQAEKRLMFLAYHDALTGLGNRTLFLDKFAALIGGQGPGEEGRPSRWALVAIGLDRFSIINGTLGHAIGDRVLVAVAHRLREPLGGHELLCRTGGDRFMMLLTDCDTDEALQLALNELTGKFQRPLEVGGHQFDLSVSLGVSLFPDHGQDAETLIMHADAALHEAKSEGGSACRLFTPAISEQANLILTMRHRMRRALEENQFKAYFQPQVDLATNRIVGSEALARWIAPDGTQVSPGEFIPIAEEYGLIDEICVQVMEDACRWTAHWNTLGLGDITVAVNISGRQFHNSRQLVEIVDSALTKLRLAPHLLDLELTESAAMSDPENASRVMRMFTDRGIGCSIDDFGTGHSSLAVLKRFTLRTLKIDRSFVKDVTSDSNDAAICSAIIAMAHELNLKVCAEGAETPDQLEFLRAHRCDKVQGFLIAKPLPPEDMERMLRAGIPEALRGPVPAN
ncbi:PAS domain S-box-containing protein/diguanylate cyclase (GGDEF) domain-containing protein [Rhodospira trueperi]|uniref:PAS domain S-box-containing protein/diguanylate cyclase (GGDEF) domain-containing protein n=1 Tax=Rhodospira trueperi TaxID=69960 RepID=A0A1G7B2R7_9PROT|nr:PAS domain S-box-containing protein/diguanylate cyclase (GGDEF) domain-containing protein [Rhodospira trueperi]